MPLPSQVAAEDAVPEAQRAAWQTTSVPGSAAHELRLAPSQLAEAHTLLASVGHAARPAWGAPLTGVHVPTEPARSQASHCPLHPVLQQTPSAQRPDRHSASEPQTCAFTFLHLPASGPAVTSAQSEPAGQAASLQHTFVEIDEATQCLLAH